MNDNLYELSSELARIADDIIEAEGELTGDIEKVLDETNLSFSVKAEGIGKWMLNIDGDVNSLQVEINRLAARKKVLDNRKERLKNYLHECMLRADKKKVEFSAFTLGVHKNPPSAEILDEKCIPAEFLTIIPESHKVDKGRVLAALKAGKKIMGARLISDRTHLKLK